MQVVDLTHSKSEIYHQEKILSMYVGSEEDSLPTYILHEPVRNEPTIWFIPMC